MLTVARFPPPPLLLSVTFTQDGPPFPIELEGAYSVSASSDSELTSSSAYINERDFDCFAGRYEVVVVDTGGAVSAEDPGRETGSGSCVGSMPALVARCFDREGWLEAGPSNDERAPVSVSSISPSAAASIRFSERLDMTAAADFRFRDPGSESGFLIFL